MPKPLTLITACDRNYLPGLHVTLLSALTAAVSAKKVDIYLLCEDVTDADLSPLRYRLDHLARKRGQVAELQRVPVSLADFEALPGLRGGNKLTYARLLAPALIDAPDALWLDADMVIFQDLAVLQGALAGCRHLVAACQDTGVRLIKNDTPVPELQSSRDDYFNAGFLWMNLAKMRSTQFTEKMGAFLERYGADLLFHDQSALNSFCHDDRIILPGHFNHLLAPWYRDNRHPISLIGKANLHYLGGDKPWSKNQRLSCYTRNLIFYHLAHHLGEPNSSYHLARITAAFNQTSMAKGLQGLVYQKTTRNQEGTEDRFQSFAEFWGTHRGRYQQEIKTGIARWVAQVGLTPLPGLEPTRVRSGSLDLTLQHSH